MTQLNFHNNGQIKGPHTQQIIPIIQKFISIYKLWNDFRDHFPQKSRYTLGSKIDSLFIDTLELLFTAGYENRHEKLPYLKRASGKLDLLKFFLQIAWKLKALDNKKYTAISEHLHEIGRMLGGWIRQFQIKPNPVN